MPKSTAKASASHPRMYPAQPSATDVLKGDKLSLDPLPPAQLVNNKK